MNTLTSASEVIDALGGPRALAGRLRIRESAVSNWRRRGISKKFRPVLRRMLDRRRLAYDPGLVWVDTRPEQRAAVRKYHKIIERLRRSAPKAARARP